MTHRKIILLPFRLRQSLPALPRTLTVLVLVMGTIIFPLLCKGANPHNEAPLPYVGQPVTETLTFTRTSRYITMRDGIKLAVDVYLPSSRKPTDRLPAILHQTRYWRALDYRWPFNLINEAVPRGLMGQYAKRFLANGYAWMSVDVRGSGASFGTRRYSHSPEEIQDGAEIVEWILHQPWSNGTIGAFGISYSGASAELLLVNQHPAVKAVAPMYSGFDIYPEIAFPGGIHLTWFTNTWTRITKQLDHNELPFGGWLGALAIRGVLPVDDDREGTLLKQAIASHARNWNPHQEARRLTFRDDRPPSNSVPSIDALAPFWYREKIQQSGAAIYSYTGWFDGAYQHGAIRRHLTYSNAHNRLIIGPWDHGGRRNISPVRPGKAEFDHAGELLKFFDHHLKGLPTGIEHEPPIHYFTMGSEQWKATTTWPPPSRLVSLYFAPHFRLQPNPPTEPHAQDEYRVAGEAGTGSQSRWHTLVGLPITDPYPNRAEQDSQLLVYTTPPLPHDWEVTGHPTITLYLSSSSPDPTIFAYLEDIGEDGSVTYVTEGMLRAIHRTLNGSLAPYRDPVPYRSFLKADAKPVIPGEVMALPFDFLPTSYVFKKGHRIRVALAGVDRDHFLITSEIPTTFRVLRSQQYPSHLSLPIVNDRK